MNPNKALWEKGDFTRIANAMRERGANPDWVEIIRHPCRRTNFGVRLIHRLNLS
jgi:hypothetical protein